MQSENEKNELKCNGPTLEAFQAEGFTNTLLRLQSSPAYAEFCEKVYGRNLYQFNVLDEEQLQKLITSLGLNSSHTVLDLGCGPGYISEYISDRTGSKVLGIDFAKEVVEAAQARTQSKSNRLQFRLGDLNSLPGDLGQFDFIIAIDTLYFVDDLLASLKKFKTFLKPHGRFAAFYSYKLKDLNQRSKFNPTDNRLGFALTQAGFAFQTYDFSLNERVIWEKTVRVANELKDSFDREGNIKIYEGRIWEAERTLTFIKDERSARAFYLTDKGV